MFKKITLGVFLSVLIIGQFTLVSSANYYEFYTTYAEPACNESAGYINLLMKNTSSGQYIVNTYFWNIVATSGGQESNAYAYITLDRNYIRFNIGGNTSTGTVSAYYHLAVFGADGGIQEVATSSSSATVRNFSSGWTCVGFKYKGNVGYFERNANFDELIADYTVYFSGNSSAILLSSILDLIGGMAQDNDVILTRLYSIINSVDGVENQLASVIDYLHDIEIELDEVNAELDQIFYKAEAILDEQKKSNTWLEKIFNYLNESAEKQKQEAQTQGNSSISQGTSSIEDKGAGFTDSITGLASSMSYTGTQCAWNMPQVKLPAITGVMDEVVLLESQPIDFSQWISVIPANIMLVIQSLLTLALIVYCFRELYNTISYVLTLRKDDNS